MKDDKVKSYAMLMGDGRELVAKAQARSGGE